MTYRTAWAAAAILAAAACASGVAGTAAADEGVTAPINGETGTAAVRGEGHTGSAGAPGSTGILLDPPIACPLGIVCHVQNYVDRDPGPGHADHACGTLSYDGHEGTDFALPDLAAMRAGVGVLAAAEGTVRATRDGLPDVSIRDPEAPDLDGRECGNGVVLDHPGGWSTQYCHLGAGSVAVRAGDAVAAGDALGEVGLSGRTEFPHLHFAVRRGEVAIDPYDADADPACGPGRSLWREPERVAYVPTGVIAAGLSPHLPTYDEVRDAPPTERAWPAAEGGALVAWLHGFGAREGDAVRIAIDGPAGPLHREEEVLDRDLAAIFRGAGRRAPEGGWPPGAYEARLTIVRGGEVAAEATARATLTAR